MDQAEERDEMDLARRVLCTFAQLSPKEMVFVQGLFAGLSPTAAAVRAGVRRSSALRYLRSIARRHPEFEFLESGTHKTRKRRESK